MRRSDSQGRVLIAMASLLGIVVGALLHYTLSILAEDKKECVDLRYATYPDHIGPSSLMSNTTG